MSTSPRQAADRAHRSDWLEVMARVGLIAFGVVHMMLAWLAITLAFGDRQGKASASGAIHELAQKPLGTALVWAVAIGMFFLVVWQGLEAALGHRDQDGAKRVLKRSISAGKAVVYLVVGISAVKVALGSGSSEKTDSTTARLMDLPAGQALVGLVALGIIGTGIGLLVVAWRESYLKRLDGQGRSGSTGKLYRWAGRAGHAAKGVTLCLVGSLFMYAAVTHEPKKSGGLDVALRKVLEQQYGPVLLTLIGVGIAGYGLFCFAQARHLDR